MNNESNSNQNGESNHPESTKSIKLPDPDPDNITVLTQNLPNKPILPWNRYDSELDEVVKEEEITEEVTKTEEIIEGETSSNSESYFVNIKDIIN
jgi:hypothetical protein